ncbi:MAG: hypothetical protein EOO70_06085 [Myxococcaceae bacterium]|nr:MAG: hypothetical protein EOO70_06085 [Myxococcaceae bacterium]
MSRGKKGAQKGKARSGPSRVLVFGESENDTHALRELIEALRPDLKGRVVPIRDPVAYIRDAKPEDVPARAEQIAKVVDIQRAVHEVSCVFVHEDEDGFEPGHEATCAKIEEALKKSGCPAHAVVPAWEMEAWWFMWPEQVRLVRPKSWRAPDDYVGKAVGRIRDVKEVLMKCVMPLKMKPEKRNSFPDYRESDAPAIARQVREHGVAREPRAKSDSYARFVRSVDE